MLAHDVQSSTSPSSPASADGFRLIQVIAVTDGQHMADMVAWFEDMGAGWVSSAWDLVQASVAPELLPAIEAHPWVRRVRRPLYPLDPEPTTRTPEEMDAWLSETKYTIDCIHRCQDTGVWPRFTDYCNAYFSECQYIELCNCPTSSLGELVNSDAYENRER